MFTRSCIILAFYFLRNEFYIKCCNGVVAGIAARQWNFIKNKIFCSCNILSSLFVKAFFSLYNSVDALTIFFCRGHNFFLFFAVYFLLMITTDSTISCITGVRGNLLFYNLEPTYKIYTIPSFCYFRLYSYLSLLYRNVFHPYIPRFTRFSSALLSLNFYCPFPFLLPIPVFCGWLCQLFFSKFMYIVCLRSVYILSFLNIS